MGDLRVRALGMLVSSGIKPGESEAVRLEKLRLQCCIVSRTCDAFAAVVISHVALENDIIYLQTIAQLFY